MRSSVRLSNVVSEIIQDRATGIRHVEIVQEVLNRGISYEGKEGLSAGVHSILKNLITKGEIIRNQNLTERKYTKSTSRLRELVPTG